MGDTRSVAVQLCHRWLGGEPQGLSSDSVLLLMVLLFCFCHTYNIVPSKTFLEMIKFVDSHLCICMKLKWHKNSEIWIFWFYACHKRTPTTYNFGPPSYLSMLSSDTEEIYGYFFNIRNLNICNSFGYGFKNPLAFWKLKKTFRCLNQFHKMMLFCQALRPNASPELGWLFSPQATRRFYACTEPRYHKQSSSDTKARWLFCVTPTPALDQSLSSYLFAIFFFLV